MAAFTLQNQKNNSQTTELELPADNSDIPFLQPKKNPALDSFNDPYKEDLIKRSAHQKTLKTLNALKIVSPIISALMQKPGVDAQNTELSQGFRTIVQETSNISEKVCQLIGVDSEKKENYWIRNVLEKNFAQILNEQWIKGQEVNIEYLTEIMTFVIDYADKVAEKIPYEDLSDEQTVKLAQINAMITIINERKNNFDMFRSLDKDLEPTMQKLFDVSISAVEKLSDEYASPKERAKLFNIIMQEAGTLYAVSWRCEAKKAKEIFENQAADKAKQLQQKYIAIGGLPIERIESDFEKYFDKMLVISEKLVASQKGASIDKRLKTKT